MGGNNKLADQGLEHNAYDIIRLMNALSKNKDSL